MATQLAVNWETHDQLQTAPSLLWHSSDVLFGAQTAPSQHPSHALYAKHTDAPNTFLCSPAKPWPEAVS